MTRLCVCSLGKAFPGRIYKLLVQVQVQTEKKLVDWLTRVLFHTPGAARSKLLCVVMVSFALFIWPHAERKASLLNDAVLSEYLWLVQILFDYMYMY